MTGQKGFYGNVGLRTCPRLSRIFRNSNHYHARRPKRPAKSSSNFLRSRSATLIREPPNYRAIQQFLSWCERAGYQDLEDIEPITVAAYIETLQRQAAPPT